MRKRLTVFKTLDGKLLDEIILFLRREERNGLDLNLLAIKNLCRLQNTSHLFDAVPRSQERIAALQKRLWRRAVRRSEGRTQRSPNILIELRNGFVRLAVKK